LAALPADSTLLLDPRRVTAGMRAAVPDTVRVVEAINPTTFAKSRKSEAEVAHVRATMEQDGAALCEFFAWLEATLLDPQRAPITELTIDEQITAARARRPGFVSPSFNTIAGFNANGAIMHYRASQASHSTIEGDGLLLIDSGGQYLGGTTDITRVVPVGTITAEHKRDFTLVLKGMMALSMAHFPRGTRGPMLDAIARAPIWAAGVDYGHGTGHGVGYFMNVHEGPQVISPSASPDPHTAMEPGMITSNEPGIYKPGRWGIRIENLVLNVPAASGEFGEFLRFETLTLCPIDTRCLDMALLHPHEVQWLNDYHATVRERLLPHVQGAARAWLELRTRAV
ncbi:MAG TPA: Xaa-Pro aminopeptidase, partial [Massilia sp.]|nr:Xaa-Pro aminopeptidase [Massilia sp.]